MSQPFRILRCIILTEALASALENEPAHEVRRVELAVRAMPIAAPGRFTIEDLAERVLITKEGLFRVALSRLLTWLPAKQIDSVLLD